MNLRTFMPQRPVAGLLALYFVAFGVTAVAAPMDARELPPSTLASASPTFHELDTNRDGLLSREETRALRDFDHAFTEADDNRDNRLDPDEFGKAQAIYERQRVGRVIGDGVITAKIKAALLKDPLVSTAAVNVATYRGTVQLSGFVQSERQIRRAMEVAAGVDGVIEVRNDLVVKS
jgi:hyperosmotically inducible periplasmic protein